jgi:hypothetical protein
MSETDQKTIFARVISFIFLLKTDQVSKLSQTDFTVNHKDRPVFNAVVIHGFNFVEKTLVKTESSRHRWSKLSIKHAWEMVPH